MRQRGVVFAWLLWMTWLATWSASATPAVLSHPGADHVFLVEVRTDQTDCFHGIVVLHLSPKRIALAREGFRIIQIDTNGESLGERRGQLSREGKEGGSQLLIQIPGWTRPHSLRRFLVFLGGPQEKGVKEEIFSGEILRLKETSEEVVVEGSYAIFHHPKQGNGGLPDKVVFPHAGTEDQGFYLEDRVYRKDLGYFALREDPEGTAKVVEPGPLRTVVRCEAVYGGRSQSENTEAQARAVYLFTYTAGSPFIQVKANVRQSMEETWNELHFLQLSRKGYRFPYWCAANGETGSFSGSETSAKVGTWGVMHDGVSGLGLWGMEGLHLWDDPDGYCNYIQSGVERFSGKERQREGFLYAGPWQGTVVMDRWVERLSLPPSVLVKDLETANRLRALWREAQEDPPLRWIVGGFSRGDPARLEEGVLARAQAAVQAWRDGEGSWARTEDRFLFQAGDLGLALAEPSLGGHVCGLAKLGEGQEFVGNSQIRGDLWKIQVGNQGESKIVVGSSSVAKGEVSVNETREGFSVVMSWPRVVVPGVKGHLQVKATIRLVKSLGEARFRIQVKNQLEETGLWRIDYPIWPGLGNKGVTDVAIPRGNWGELLEGFDGKAYGSTPGGHWNMQFFSLSEGKNTLYLAAEDSECSTKHMECAPGGETLFWYPVPDMGVQGKGFELEYDIVAKPMPGTWYDAARRYREWALEQPWTSKGPIAQRDDIPKAFRDGLLWFLGSGGPADVTEPLLQAQDFFQLPMGFHWYNWHQIPFDNDYPHYFPVKEGFEDAVKRLKEAGLTIMPYINGRLWDSDTESFQKEAHRYCTVDEHGEPYIEIYGSGEKLVPMCPYTQYWQDGVAEIVHKLLYECGVNAVYLDQIGAAGPRLCMNEEHGHPLGGGSWWVPSYRKMLRRIQKDGAQKDERIFFTTENNAEAYMDVVDGFLIWNYRRPEWIPLYATVYADMTCAFCSPACPGDDETAFAMKQGRDFVWGTQLGWMSFWLLEPGNRGKADYLKTLAQARLDWNRFFSYGEFLRPPVLQCPGEVTSKWIIGSNQQAQVTRPAILGSAWRSRQGEVAVILTNTDNRERKARLMPPAELKASEGYEVWEERGGVKSLYARRPSREETVDVLLPGRSVALYLFEESDSSKKSLSPQIPTEGEMKGALEADLDFEAKAVRAGESIRGWLRLRHPEGLKAEETLQVKLPGGFLLEPSPRFSARAVARMPKKGIPLLLHAPQEAEAGNLQIHVERVEHTGQGFLEVRKPRKRVQAVKLQKTLSLDGDLADWPQGPVIRLPEQGISHVEGWTGSEDLSAQLRLAWNESHLWVGIQVRDDVHDTPYSQEKMWDGDAIQLAFDPFLDTVSGLDGNDVEVGLSLQETGPFAYLWAPLRREAAEVDLAAQRQDDLTTYECRIPRALLHNMDRTGFSFTVNERDRGAQFDGWMEWTPGICGPKDASAFGLLLME